MNDQTRNLNPTPEARLAMYLWTEAYAKSGGGSMDFWDSLSEGAKDFCRRGVKDILEAARNHNSLP